jgi:hypothetical protein
MQSIPSSDELTWVAQNHLRLARDPANDHGTRVSLHLLTIVDRERLAIGLGLQSRESKSLKTLTGLDGSVSELNAQLAERLRHSTDDSWAAEACAALQEITRADLQIVKPGYEQWTRG